MKGLGGGFCLCFAPQPLEQPFCFIYWVFTSVFPKKAPTQASQNPHTQDASETSHNRASEAEPGHGRSFTGPW